MKAIVEKCAICGHEDISNKKVETILKGGNNTCIVQVSADVCRHCGEKYFAPDTIRFFEKIRKQLKLSKTPKEFKKVGSTFVLAQAS